MSETNWTEIREAYESGASLRALAEKYGISKSTIDRHAKMGQWDTNAGQRDSGQAQLDTNPTPKKEVGTKEGQRLFLEAYAVHANVMLSAKEAGVHRSTVYDWLEKDEDFSFAYNQAKEDAKDTLRAEIYRRGHDGWEEAVYQLGHYAGTVQKYSDTLLIFHAKALMPEYRDKSSVDVNATVNGTLTHVRKLHALSDEELDALERMASKALEERHGS